MFNTFFNRDGKLALDEAGCYMFAGEEDTTVEPSADSAMVDYFDDGHNTELTVSYRCAAQNDFST